MSSATPQSNPYVRLYGRQLSEAETAEVRQNLVGFFGLLVEIDRELTAKAKDEATSN